MGRPERFGPTTKVAAGSGTTVDTLATVLQALTAFQVVDQDAST